MNERKLTQVEYHDSITDMLTMTAFSHPATTLQEYLTPLEIKFKDDFDPIKALDSLIKNAEILRDDLLKKMNHNQELSEQYHQVQNRE